MAASEVVKVAFFALLNIFSVVLIVSMNKTIFGEEVGFKFPTTLVAIHSIVTWFGLKCASLLGGFEPKAFDRKPLILMALSFAAYNVASQANLNLNTIGFYQISKILVTPAVMIAQLCLFGMGTTFEVKFCVLLMCIGVGLATVSELSITIVGFCVGMAAVIGAAQQQIVIKRFQQNLEASSNQLLLAYTPYCFAVLMLMSPIDGLLPDHKFANVLEWMQSDYATPAHIAFIIGSGFCGLFVSLSTFLFIKSTGPLTYNIVGHLKTISILTTGYFFFHEDMNQQKVAGIVIAMIAVIWYSRIKLKQMNEKATEKEAAADLESSNDESKNSSQSDGDSSDAGEESEQIDHSSNTRSESKKLLSNES
jgi:solute carrier family 35 protein E3